MLSRDLSFLEEGILSAADHWAEFHPDAFKITDEANSRDESEQQAIEGSEESRESH